jgi:hypothetical protein
VHLASGQVLGQGARHVGSASVLNAHEEQFGHGFDKPPISLGGRGELLRGESGDQHGQEVWDGRGWFQGSAGVGNCLGDGVAGEGAFVVVSEVIDQAVVVGHALACWLTSGFSGGGCGL